MGKTNYCAECERYAQEVNRLTADLESTKIKYADCARLLEDAELLAKRREWGAKEMDRLRKEIVALREELNSITYVAMTSEPAGWWIAPRGSTDPTEWICVDEMWHTPQCQECGRDAVEAQWVCEHCGHRTAIDDAAKINHAMSEDRRHTADELTAQAQEDVECDV